MDGIGPQISAVMCVSTRRPNHALTLQGQCLPFVDSYRYLGVVLHRSGRCTLHLQHLLSRGERKFHQLMGWVSNRQLPVDFAVKLFGVYILPSVVYASWCLSSSTTDIVSVPWPSGGGWMRLGVIVAVLLSKRVERSAGSRY